MKSLFISYFLMIINLFSQSNYYPKENFTQANSTISSINKSKLDNYNDEIYLSRRNILTNCIENVSPAVVGISITETKKIIYNNPYRSYDDLFDMFFNRYRSKKRVKEYEVHGVGSGFLISGDGFILTNHHVVGNASKIVVTLTSGKEYNATLIGSDYTTDIALLKIDGFDFPYLKFCETEAIIGEWAIALGNPFGLFDKNSKPTVTLGVVSNKDIDFIQEENGNSIIYKGMIQTDAAISSGNSGGPLVNALGEVIGMNTIIFSTATDNQGAGSIGIGFAIPINRVKSIVDKFINNEKIDRNYDIGLDVRAINNEFKKILNINVDKGLIIYGINKNSPSFNAGLEPGDVIISIDNKEITNLEDYYLMVEDKFANEELIFVILRDNKELVKRIKLTKNIRKY